METEASGGRNPLKDRWSAVVLRMGEECELPNGCSCLPSWQSRPIGGRQGRNSSPRNIEGCKFGPSSIILFEKSVIFGAIIKLSEMRRLCTSQKILEQLARYSPQKWPNRKI
jgi:hypothetical protein